MALIDTARQWREQHGYIGKGGVVIVFDGGAQGWVDRLRNPEHWRPGRVAIDEAGQSWTAVNGNDQMAQLRGYKTTAIHLQVRSLSPLATYEIATGLTNAIGVLNSLSKHEHKRIVRTRLLSRLHSRAIWPSDERNSADAVPNSHQSFVC